MVNVLERLSKSLKDNGYSFTAARRTVFAALQGHEPQTMQEIVAASPGIDRASVYRIIALFEQLGIVQRLQIGWKYKLELTDPFSHHHHHFSCNRCGRVTELPEDHQLEARLWKLAKTNGLVVQDHQLELRGLCQSCAS